MGCLPEYLFIKFKCGRRPTNQAVVAVDDEESCVDNVIGGVRKYNWNEIEKITANFSKVIGSGGFSTVYLAHLRGSTLGAVKILCSSDHLNGLFNQELDILLGLRHQNIVKLLGYSDHIEEGALVFEYVPNGSLQDKLHGSSSRSMLSWRKRTAIAFQLAQALEYLHDKCPLQIVHGDIKASNILLDDELNCKLCDFGFAKMGFSSAIMGNSLKKQVMIGSPGYTDPHYLRTGIASKKNDVYSYGVIILELVTGMEAFCEERGQLLTSIMGPMMKDTAIGGNDSSCAGTAMKVAQMVDPRLGGEFDVKEARVMLSLSSLCLAQSPMLRPSATQILGIFKDSISSCLFSPGKDLHNLCH